ncbi:unnamed protein product, partial [Cuscuta epithymum]
MSRKRVTQVFRKVWRWEASGRFSVRSCYRRLAGDIQVEGWVGWTEMWNCRLPPKIKSFFWQLCSDCLPTTKNLRSRMVNCQEVCGLCGKDDESVLHLFVRCPVAIEGWKAIGWDVNGAAGGNFLHCLELIFQAKKKPELEKVVWGCWGLWEERNRRVWQNKTLNASQVMFSASCFVDGWLFAQQKDQAKVTALGAQVWRLPKPGWCKMNVDAVRDHTGSWFGWAVRNSSGDFVGGGIKSGRGSCF